MVVRTMNQKTRQKVYNRANRRCEICGRTTGLQIHHIVRRSQLGSDKLDNLILLCWNCHHGTRGVHGREGAKLDLRLKLDLQRNYVAEGYTETEIRRLMGGKIYLEEELNAT